MRTTFYNPREDEEVTESHCIQELALLLNDVYNSAIIAGTVVKGLPHFARNSSGLICAQIVLYYEQPIS